MEPYELRTADEGKLKVIRRCMVDVIFHGVKVQAVLYSRCRKLKKRSRAGHRWA